MRLSRTHGGRGRTLQRPHPPWPRHSRIGFLLWLDMCENNIIGRADNHYFRKISFFAMARCSLLGSCYGSLRPCALLLPRKSGEAAAALCSGRTLAAFSGGSRTQPTPHPNDTPFGSMLAACFLLWLAATLRPAAPPKKRRGRGRTLQRPHPRRFFGGQQDAAHPPPKRYPLWLGVRCLFPAMARCVNAPSCSPKQRKGAGARPQAAVPQPPSAVWGAGRCVPSAPPSGGGRGQAGARPQAAVHQPAPFRRRCPCSPPRGASLLICFFHLNRCSLLFSCYGSMQEISFMAAIAF